MATLPEARRPSTYFCSLSQNAHFMTNYSMLAPSLVRNSFVYRIVACSSTHEERPAIPLEYFAMQVIPVLLPRGHLLGSVWPPQEVAAMSPSVCRSVCGNGMNLAAVGSVLLFSLGSMDVCR